MTKITTLDDADVIKPILDTIKNSKDPLDIEIDCPGGNPYWGIEYATAIEAHGKVTITNIGRCESAAMFVFSAGQTRMAKNGTEFMVHEVSWNLDYLIQGLMIPEYVNGQPTGKYLPIRYNTNVHIAAIKAHVNSLLSRVIAPSESRTVKLTQLLNGKLPPHLLSEMSYKDVRFTDKEARLWGIVNK